MDELCRARAVALGLSLEASTHSTYRSGLNSFLAFCDNHHLPITPSPDTISLFVVYMSHHIDPKSVRNYLQGLTHCLEPYYPFVREACQSRLVKETLAGCRKLRSKPTIRKPPILASHIRTIINIQGASGSFDDTLFVAMTVCAHFGLHRLGELTAADVAAHRSHRKLIKRFTVIRSSVGHSYTLPYHKADRYYLGSTVVIPTRTDALDPSVHIENYLQRRDSRFPLRPELFIKLDGTVPTRSWYVNRLQHLFPEGGFAGHSLRAGGATELALQGVPESLIRRMGRWTSDAFERYIRVHPVLLAAVLARRSDATSLPSSSDGSPPHPRPPPQNRS